MYADYRAKNDFVGMDMCRKFLEMGFTRDLERYKEKIIKMVKNMIRMVI